MTARQWVGRAMQDTAFSIDRLKIWALSFSLLVSVIGIIYLGAKDKEVMPLGTIAGTIIGYFTGRNYKGGRND